jgi:hypothetical protein
MSDMPIAQWFVTIGVLVCAVAMAFGGLLVVGKEKGEGAKSKF